ncbi:MAG: hypothetical protein Harvfovirus1_51 [Harvfovirus sp.]|uniref:Uncharacterized protein n=1 Tax=Harvfovirus sp. TaxID=2487768 RepID=A0A3G4ZZM9_9VIRU|nr:MAG: hypothetical protein Harvfovirus1_51 [Harvfovirus sp.]
MDAITFDEFLVKKYSHYDNIILDDAQIIFDRLDAQGKKLKAVSKYIEKVKYSVHRLALVADLTEHHYLTVKQFLSIWNSPQRVKIKTCPKWINNLIKNNYCFDYKLLQQMVQDIPKVVIQIVMGKKVENVGMDDFYIVCANGDLVDIKKFYDVFMLTPDIQCFVFALKQERKEGTYEELYHFFKKMGLEFKVNETILAEANLRDFDILDLMIKDGMKLSNDILRYVYGAMSLEKIKKYTLEAVENNVKLELDLLLGLQFCGDLDVTILYDIFFVREGLIPTQDFCDKIVGNEYEKLYNYLVLKKLFVHSDIAMEVACIHGNENLIKDLIITRPK